MKLNFGTYIVFFYLFASVSLQCVSNRSLIKPMKHKFDFYTAYHQFYINDSESTRETDSKDFWNEESGKQRLAIGEGILGILTKSYGHIKGKLEILDKEREIDSLDLYDHVVEAGIEIKSGILQILDCPNSEVEMEVKVVPGFYKIRVYSRNLDILENEDEEEGNDFYNIEIWKDKNLGLRKRVLKEYIKDSTQN